MWIEEQSLLPINEDEWGDSDTAGFSSPVALDLTRFSKSYSNLVKLIKYCGKFTCNSLRAVFCYCYTDRSFSKFRAVLYVFFIPWHYPSEVHRRHSGKSSADSLAMSFAYRVLQSLMAWHKAAVKIPSLFFFPLELSVCGCRSLNHSGGKLSLDLFANLKCMVMEYPLQSKSHHGVYGFICCVKCVWVQIRFSI